ncbi:hypothetical protein GGF49_003603 [Coemansia sp. RSA 1853]|nr:hypothetical protein GGF49_003603 [Coemansia sp. RSA 1853]
MYKSSDNEDGGQLWISPKLPRASTHPVRGRANTQPTKPTARPLASTPKGKAVRPVHSESRPRLELRLSAAQTLAWVAPRILFLFALGWAWAASVQFFHAQADQAWGFGDYDSTDSSDSDDDVRGQRHVVARALGGAQWGGAASGALTVCVGLGLPFLDVRWQSFPASRMDWHSVLRSAGGFLAVNYAALKLPFESAAQSALAMLIISLGLWTVCDGSLHGLLVAGSAALGSTWLLLMHVVTRADVALDDCASLLPVLPSILFTYCVMTGCVGRRLGYHPQWRQSRSS